MTRISSRRTYFLKRLFPIIWFGILGVSLFGLTATPATRQMPWALYGVPVAMAALGYVIMRKFVFDLADEVFDGGDHLLVRFGDEQERIPLDSIINVNQTVMVNPPRATLTLRSPGRFGKTVVFSPIQTGVLFRSSPIMDTLIERIDAARRAKA